MHGRGGERRRLAGAARVAARARAPVGRDRPGDQLDGVGRSSRSARRASPSRPQTVRFVARAQTKSGGFAWASGLRPDTDDTAAAVQALAASGVRGKPVTRALAYLRTDSGPTAASSCSRAQARTCSRRRGRSRRSSRPARSRPRRRFGSSRACDGPTGASATRRATRRRRCGSPRRRCRRYSADRSRFASVAALKPDAVERAEQILGKEALDWARVDSRGYSVNEHWIAGFADKSRAFLKVASVDPSPQWVRDERHVFDCVVGAVHAALPRFRRRRPAAAHPRGHVPGRALAAAVAAGRRRPGARRARARLPLRRSPASCRACRRAVSAGLEGRRSRSGAVPRPRARSRRSGSSVRCRRCSRRRTRRCSTANRSCTATCAATTSACAAAAPCCSTGITRASAIPRSTSPSGCRASRSKAGRDPATFGVDELAAIVAGFFAAHGGAARARGRADGARFPARAARGGAAVGVLGARASATMSGGALAPSMTD